MFEIEQIGRRIADHRKKQNLTQQDLADQLGVTYQAVSNWERGLSVPDVLRLKDLARYFEITLDELMGNQQDARVVKVASGEEKPETIRELAQSAPYMKPRDLENELLERVGMSVPEKGSDFTVPEPPVTAASLNQTDPTDAQADSRTDASSEQDLSLEDLAAMAPFLSPEVLLQVARRLVESDTVSGMEPLAALAPFLDPEGLRDLFLNALDHGLSVEAERLFALAPFLDPDGVEAIADRILTSSDSNLSLAQLSGLAPFMDSYALGRMARQLAGSGESNPGAILALAPSLDSADLRELIKASPVPSPELIRGLLPFMDEADIEELLLENINRE